MSRFAKMVIAVAIGAAALVASAMAFANSAHAQGRQGASGGFRGGAAPAFRGGAGPAFRGGAISRPSFAGNRGIVRAAPRAGFAGPRSVNAPRAGFAPRAYGPGIRPGVRPGARRVYRGYPGYGYYNPYPVFGYGYGYNYGYPVASPYACETRRVRVRTHRGWRVVWRRFCY